MNKHLLQSRLRSLAHYNGEVQKIEDAKKVTEQTRSEVLASLKEFFPFSKGDVLVYQGRMLRLVELEAVHDLKAPKFMVNYEYPKADYYGHNTWEKSQYSFAIPISDIDKVKVIDASVFEPAKASE